MIYLRVYKSPKNPKILELSKSHKERSYQLSDLRVVKIEGQKYGNCVWCGDVKLGHHNQKYCSPTCSNSAMAWGYPQTEHGLNVLLARQSWKCNLCQYDYRPMVDIILSKLRPYDRPANINEDFAWTLIKRLKAREPRERRPEVDHIVPIYKGGQSIGLENHQAICYSCHKNKTAKDLSGPRKKAPCPACTKTGTIHKNCILR